MIAGVCFGPPPLPPNKRPLTVNIPSTSAPKIRQCTKLKMAAASQTYQSFQTDEDDEIYYINENNQKTPKKLCSNKSHHKKCQNCHKKSGNRKKYLTCDNIELFELKNNYMLMKSQQTQADDGHYEPKCLKKYKNYEHIDQDIEQELVATTAVIPSQGTIKRCLKHYGRQASFGGGGRKYLGVNNSLNRDFVFNRYNLVRSHSDGNLAAKGMQIDLSGNATTTLNKCLKALSGSWKNLLYRKYC